MTVTVTTDADQQPHGPGGTLTVAAGGGTAVSGSDYDAFNQTYALDAAGFSAATVGGSRRWQAAYTGTVTVSDDTTQESAETFNITLSKLAPKVTLASPSAFVVTIPANDAPAASSDAGLSALSLSGVTLSPDFAATTYDYTASVANSVSSTTVAAAQNHAGAAVVITPTVDADAGADGHQVNLDAGSNTITVKVTAEDDTTTRTYTVMVTRAVPAPPAPVSASVDATVLTLVFDAALDEARVPHLSQFSVTRTPSGGSAADVAVASGGVLVSGAEVALTLASAVAAGDTVTVGYSKAADASATAVLLRAAAAPNLEAAAFTGQAVTNDTPEPPAPVSGSVNGDTLMLVFDAELDASATLLPTWPQFTVAVTKPDNTARTVYPVTAAGGIAVAGTTVTLKLRSPVGHGDTVTVAYSQTDTSLSSTARLLTGADGLAVAEFSGRAVANVTALEPLSASAAADTLTMVFNAALDAARVPHGSQFEVMVAPAGGGSAAGVDVASDGVAVEGAAVALTLASPVARGDTVTVGYSKTADAGATAVLLRAEAAPNAEADAFAGREVTNDTPPAPVSASVNGVTLVLVFDAELDASAESLPTWPQFTVAATRPDNTATTVSPVTGAGGVAVEGMTVTLTLGSPVAHDDHEVKVAYSQSTTSTSGDVTTTARLLAGADGLAVAEFSAQDVDNVTPAPPMPVSAKVDGVTLTMVFDTALDATRVPHHSQFTVTKAPAGGTAADVAVASGGVAVTDTTVALTLASPVVMGDAVTVGYSKTAGAGETAVLLRAEAAPNLEADAFTGQSVTNVTAAPASSDAGLSTLSLSGVTLTPTFAAGIAVYAASVANSVSSTTVTAAQNHAAAAVVITPMVDADASADGHQVDLDVGSNTITVKVTAEDGTTTRTYTVTVTRAAPPASSDVVTVPADWTLKPSGLGAGDQFRLLIVTATTRNASSIDISDYDSHVQTAVAAGHAGIQSHSSQFKVLASTASVAARDHTETTYTSADKGVPIYWLGGAKAADEYEDFYDGSWDSYVFRDQTGNEASPLRVWTGTNNDGTAASNFLGSTDGVGAGTKTSGKHFVNSVLFSGTTYPFYGLSAVFQVAAAVTPPSLSALTVSAGTLMPGFAGGTLDYAVPGLAYGHNRITVTAAADADATVSYEDGSGNTLSDADANTAGDQFDLAVGENTIKVKVARGDASQTYTLTLTRAKPVVSVSAAAAAAGEGDLLMFTVTRTPAAGDALTVTVNVAESGDLVPAASEGDRTVTIAADAAAATLTVNTGADDSDWGEHSTVTVTAPSNTSYTLGVAGASTLVQDDDFPAAEAALAVSPTTVDESGTATVTVTVTTDADQQPHGRGGTLTVAAGGGTAVSGSDYDAFNRTYALDAAGFSAATVGGSRRWQAAYTGTVTVSDDTTQESAETFNITLSKLAPKVTLASPSAFVVTIPANDAPAASSDAGLSALSLSGVTLSPDFAATTYDYTASVANSVSSTTVAAAQNHAGAEVVITPTVDADAGADGHQVNLDAGSNTITVEVTAEDDTTTRTYTVTVTRAAPAPPAPVSASVDATVLTLVFDAALDEARVPHLSQFSVTRTPSGGSAADVAVASGGVVVTDTTVALTLASAVAAGDTVTVGYSKAADASATAVLLRAEAAPNPEVAAFTGQAVTNDTPEPPAPVSGSVNGDTLVLVFDKVLDVSAASLPTWPQFTVAATGPGADPLTTVVYPVAGAGGIAVAGMTVTLKLRSPVGHGDTVTVAYSQSTTSTVGGVATIARLLTGADGLAVADFSGRAVANVTALEPLSASAAADTLTMVFNAALDATRVPHGSQFEVMVAPAGGGSAAGVDVAPDGVAVEGAEVALTLASPVARGDTVTVGYSKTADAGATAVLLRAEAAPNAEADAFAGREVTNDTPPAPVSASVNGVTLVLVFDAELDASAESLPTWPQFTVAVAGPDNTATTVSPGAGGVAVEGMTVTLTLGSPVAHDDTVKVAYSQSTTSTSGSTTTIARLLAGADGLAVAEFSAQDVDNVTPAPPMPVSAKVDGVTLTMVFDTALDAASVPHGSQFTVTKAPAGGTAADVAVASGGVVVADTTVALTLASPVVMGDAVTVGYSKTAGAGATAAPLRAAAAPNLEADAFTGQSVTNVTAAPSLSALTVSAGTLMPGFAGGTLDYAVPGLAYGHNRITVTAAADADATVSYEDGSGNTLSDADANTAGDQFDLAVGENTIKVKVARGDASQTYTLTLTRAKPVVSVSAAAAAAGEGDLLMFTVTRTPAAGDALTLTVNVAESGDLVPAASEGDRTVTIAADAAAETLTVNTGADDSDWGEHSTVTVTATADAGYTLGVAGASTLVQDDDFPAAEAALVVSPTTVDESGTATVTVTVTTDADQQPHGRGGTLTVAAGGGTAVSGSDYDAFNRTYALDAAGFSAATFGGSPRWQAVYTGTVTVSDDTTQESAETFNVALTKGGAPKVTLASPSAFVVTIPANDAPAASSDAGLSALSLSGVTLSPDFAATTYDYTASVANSVSSTTVAAAQNHAGAEVVITPTVDADAGADGHQVNLDAGSNTITVEVTAEDDTTTRTYTVTVTRAAPAPPAPVSASVDATVLTLVFDAALDEARVPHLSQFSVMRTPSGGSAADVAVASGGVVVTDTTVALTLASAVAAGDTVTVGYSKAADASATAVLLRAEAAPNPEVAAFTGQAVTNDTPEPPAPVSGSVNGDTLMLVFDKDLDASATLLPTWPQFTVAATGPGADPLTTVVYPVAGAGGIAVAGTTVTLKLRSPVGHGDTVKVAYSQTDTSTIGDVATTARLLTGANGAAVAEFSGQEVTNNTPEAGAVPALSSASVNATVLTLVFDAALDTSSVPHLSQFTVRATPAGGTAADVAVAPGGVVVSNTTVTLTLASAVAAGDAVTVGYSKAATESATARPLRAAAAPNLEADEFTAQMVANNTGAVAPVVPPSGGGGGGSAGGGSAGGGSAGGGSAAPPPEEQRDGVVFDDVDESDAHFAAVRVLAGGGVLAGTLCAPLRFCGGEALPRWVMAVWLVRVVDGRDPAPVASSRFADVDPGLWWARHVERLAELGITRGCSRAPARYCPQDPVTRAQMASFLRRAFKLAAAAPAGFADTAGSVHAASIDALSAAGITRGCATGPLRYCPRDPVTRAQMAAFLVRAGPDQERPGRARRPRFDDINASDAHFTAVRALAADGVLDGTLCAPLRFCGGETLPRWMMAVWLVRVIDGRDPAPVASSRFADVDPGLWWARHAERLAELGITRGCSRAPARYCPQDPVTRAQMASFLRRAFKLAAAAPAGFADTAGSVHAASIDALSAAGITQGCATGPLRYCPRDPVTRAQMAAFLVRARAR